MSGDCTHLAAASTPPPPANDRNDLRRVPRVVVAADITAVAAPTWGPSGSFEEKTIVKTRCSDVNSENYCIIAVLPLQISQSSRLE